MPINQLSLANTYGAGVRDRQNQELRKGQLNAQERAEKERIRRNALLANPEIKPEHLQRAGLTQDARNVAEVNRAGAEDARGVLARGFGAIAQAADPTVAAQSIGRSPEFVQAAQSMGLPVDQMLAQASPEQIRQGAMNMARNFGGDVGGDEGPVSPSNVREWEYYNSLSPEDQQRYLTMKRSGRVTDVNGVPTIVNPGGNTQPLSTLESEVDAAGQIAGAESAARTAGTQGGLTLTPGEKVVDEKFAAEYNEWVNAGGYADVAKNAEQLHVAIQSLRNGEISGPWRGLLPDTIRNITNPEAVDTKELITEVVQRNLRLILGAQFTEREGERLISRAYNDQQEESVNIQRVERLLNQIMRAAAAKDEAAKYFAQHGTMSGYTGHIPSISDFVPDDGPRVVKWSDL